MKILAFDLGSTMAVAQNMDGYPAVDSQAFKGVRVKRMAETLRWLEIARDHSPGLGFVIYERPFARGQHATRSLWGLAGLIEAVFGGTCPVVDTTPAEIKKWATGNAKAEKNEMIAAAQCMGYSGVNEHEADAFLLLHYAIANHTEEK